VRKTSAQRWLDPAPGGKLTAMTRNASKLGAAAAALAAVLTLAPAARAATIEIRIERSGFVPNNVTVAAGDTVRWTNRDTADHQVVSDTGTFASPILKARQSYSFTFRDAGTFRYRDALKPAERGTVRVTGPPPGVTLAATVPIVVYGAQSRLQGTVSSKQAGEQVSLFQAAYGAAGFTPLTVVTTGAGGTFDVAVTPTILTAYVAQYRGVSSGDIRIQVRPKVTLMPSGLGRLLARVTGGGSFAGRYVYLQRKSGFGQWVSIARFRLGAASGKLFRPPRRRGVAVYRVFITVNQAGAGYLESWSGTQTIRRR
jgi:plastocyanin